MKEATLIYPHQLFANPPTIAKGRVIYLIEETLILTHNPIHRQKLVFHKLSMDAYEARLREAGDQVNRRRIHEYPTTQNFF
ncbi:MAG: cryptochrome/photolyase family protein [Patescibacteria group bacterium]